jgi:hypothetical protein
MRRRGFSPGPSGLLSVTPNATSEAPAKPHLLGHALFWIALHMMASSCLVMRSASLPSMCPASPTADDSQQASRIQRHCSQEPDPPCVHRHVPSNSFQCCIRHARPPHSDTAHRAAVAAGSAPRVVVRLRLLLSAFCRLRFFLSPCSVLGAVSLLFAFTLSLDMMPNHLPALLLFQ